VIIEILGRAFPEHGVLGEEFGGAGTTDTRWIIDPIDGTKNFVRHIPLWATLIALEERGEITVGVVHNPVTGDLYTARRGAGAFLNGERITVSAYLSRGRGVLALPGGVFEIDRLAVVGVHKNRLGAVKVEEGLGLVTYTALFGPAGPLDGPPIDSDLHVPGPDAATIARIVANGPRSAITVGTTSRRADMRITSGGAVIGCRRPTLHGRTWCTTTIATTCMRRRAAITGCGSTTTWC